MEKRSKLRRSPLSVAVAAVGLLMFSGLAASSYSQQLSLTLVSSNENPARRQQQQQQTQQSCWDQLPAWALSSSANQLKEDIVTGSDGLTDKTNPHRYHYMYHQYLSQLVIRSCMDEHHHHQNATQPTTIRILEIGLGCSPNGGMLRGEPGGSTRAWHYLFANNHTTSLLSLDLHVMEYDAECAKKWSKEYPDIATLHTGDASNPNDLERVYQEAGGQPFDMIIDDASHLNEHQIKTLEYMIQHVAAGGFYVVEDINSSCTQWKVNKGSEKTFQKVLGTPGCMETTDGKETIFAKIVEWQKVLVYGRPREKGEPFPNVFHIDVHHESVVFQKRLD